MDQRRLGGGDGIRDERFNWTVRRGSTNIRLSSRMGGRRGKAVGEERFNWTKTATNQKSICIQNMDM